MSAEGNQLSHERLRVWVRRLMWVLGISLLAIAVCAYLGYHTGWIGVIASFTFAEFTRRISGEQRPGGPLSWIEIFRFGYGLDNEPRKNENLNQKDGH